MNENRYQGLVIDKIQAILPHAVVLKNDSGYRQGIPDIVVFCGMRYAMIEVKTSEYAPFQPNQEYYLDLFDHMSYAAVIFPENEERVLYELRRFLGS